MASTKKILFGGLAALFLGQSLLHAEVLRPFYMSNYSTGSAEIREGLPPEYQLLQLLEFREFIAGILWVRADTFFDSGNYDAILPIIRLVTWLDPHYLDVYATGMWHLGYNFTDEESRSDRRYIPFALALGKEGSKNNANTYEIFFETGWMWFHKIDDNYENAVKWFGFANEKKDIVQARKNLLSNARFRNGQVREALDWYFKVLDEAQKSYDFNPEFQARQMRDTIENNVDTTIVRMAQRGWFAQERNDGSFLKAPYDTRPPFDVGFSARVTVEEPMVLRVEGTWNVLPVGTRVRIVLRDADFEEAIPAGMDWDYADTVDLDPPREKTFMQDALFVRNRRFNRRLDMSKDPTMYPLVQKDYVIEFYYNPRSAAAHIQDKFGFNGEGMTDKLFVNSEVRPGQRVIYAKLNLTRDQLKRRGQWRDVVPVVRTPNFKAMAPVSGAAGSDIIQVPGLRSESAEKPTTAIQAPPPRSLAAPRKP